MAGGTPRAFGDVAKYSYSVGWSNEDLSFVARVAEFPSLAAHGSTERKALEEIRRAVRLAIADLLADGAPVPPPRA